MESSSADRVIVLIDMDCFYVQVEQKLHPEYQNTPCAVVQYETWKGGTILAVNYEARAKGVTRFEHGNEALKKCPDIHLFSVPEIRGKGDLSRYREAGALVLDVLCEYCDCVERASIDEAFLDLTSVICSRMQNASITADQLPNTFVVGWENEDPDSRNSELQKWLQMIYDEECLYNDQMLAVAAVMVEEIREAVYERTGFRCSAGIAHNKMLAKLSCGINKPNKQTVLPQSSIQLLFKTIPIKKVRNLGGKLGKAITEKFGVEKMGDLINISKSQFVSQFGAKTGNWLYNLIRGIDNEPVTSRQLPKSIGCGKIFPKQSSLSTRKDVSYWVKQLTSELQERLMKDQSYNKRFAHLLTVSIRNRVNNGYSLVSRSCPIRVYDAEKLAHDALLAISKLNTSSNEILWTPSIYTLSIVASKFEDKMDSSCSNIQSYLINSKIFEESDKIKGQGKSVSSACEINNTTADNIFNVKLAKNSSRPIQSITNFFAIKEEDSIETVYKLDSVTGNKVHNFDTNFDSVTGHGNDSINTCKLSNIDVISAENNSGNILGDKPESLGFFAKKLAESSEFNNDIVFEKPYDISSENEITLSETVNKSKPSTSSVSDAYSDLDLALTKLCDKCHKRFPVWEETEHLDYHLAVTLSNELSKSPAVNSSNSNKNSSLAKDLGVYKSKGRGIKRSKSTKSSPQAKKSIQKNTLDAFIK